ncbi:MAG: HAMP domain-containing sensor histidine kinase [Polyangiaceae bacterium]
MNRDPRGKRERRDRWDREKARAEWERERGIEERHWKHHAEHWKQHEHWKHAHWKHDHRWEQRRGYFHGPRLRRKIFWWFGITIAITTAGVMTLANRNGGGFGWGATVSRARTFLGGQFAAVWTEPARRDALAADLAREIELGVRLTDENGATIGTFGEACDGKSVSTPVEREGHVVGAVQVCDAHHRHPSFFIPIAVAIGMLWAASGAIAHRLVRPLSELARVAQDIGKGELASRVRLSPRHGMEFVMVGNVMNEMAQRIEKQLADQRALLATVSHEIRTPLSRMRLLIEFAREKAEANLERLAELKKALGDPAHAAGTAHAAGPDASPNADGATAKGPLDEMAQLEREVTEIDALVSDLLASSRIDFTALTRTELDAVEVAKNALERCGIDASRLEVSGASLPFSGDATLVARAVSNLLENAKRHAGGVDTLRIDSRADTVAFIVEDRGPGFAPGDETRVFEPFYKRVSVASNGEESVGLGLALVKKIAEAHQGRVFAENRENGGARVGVEFAR